MHRYTAFIVAMGVAANVATTVGLLVYANNIVTSLKGAA